MARYIIRITMNSFINYIDSFLHSLSYYHVTYLLLCLVLLQKDNSNSGGVNVGWALVGIFSALIVIVSICIVVVSVKIFKH